MSKPFLKWAGGKYTQLADLFVHIPAGKRLIEPFVGGGSVTWYVISTQRRWQALRERTWYPG